MDNYRWDGSNRKDGFNNRTYVMLFRDYYVDSSKKTDRIYKTIANFTLSPFKNYLIKDSIKSRGFSLIKKSFNGYQYNDSRSVYNFDIISNKIKNDKLKKELESVYRYGMCHKRSLELSTKIKNSRVITGYIILSGMKILHSVVEVEKDNQKLILDWTKNLIIKKEDYKKLTGFYEISKISREDILKDNYLFSKFDISLKTYVLFRDEIILSLNKNIDLIKDNNNYLK